MASECAFPGDAVDGLHVRDWCVVALAGCDELTAADGYVGAMHLIAGG